MGDDPSEKTKEVGVLSYEGRQFPMTSLVKKVVKLCQ